MEVARKRTPSKLSHQRPGFPSGFRAFLFFRAERSAHNRERHLVPAATAVIALP